jgi:hypothetical protein
MIVAVLPEKSLHFVRSFGAQIEVSVVSLFHHRVERRLRLISAIARGRRWLDEIISGSIASAEQIAARERCSVRHVNMTISLAFLAPKLVRAAVEGRLPRGINIERLRDAPAEWSRQFEALGLI